MTFPTDYEPVARGAHPAGSPRRGTRALRDAFVLNVPKLGDDGIYNPRDVCGHQWPNVSCALSLHFDGRAWDAATTDVALGDAVAAVAIAAAAELGVCEVIWQRRRWTTAEGWLRYRGRSPHTDHVHLGQTSEAAAGLTALAAGVAVRRHLLAHPKEITVPTHQPSVAARTCPTGGRWVLDRDGGIRNYGGAPYLGSYPGLPPEARQGSRDLIDLEVLGAGDAWTGYRILGDDGSYYDFARHT